MGVSIRMSEYRTHAHTVRTCKYHFVWCRKSNICDAQSQAKRSFAYLAESSKTHCVFGSAKIEDFRSLRSAQYRRSVLHLVEDRLTKLLTERLNGLTTASSRWKWHVTTFICSCSATRNGVQQRLPSSSRDIQDELS